MFPLLFLLAIHINSLSHKKKDDIEVVSDRPSVCGPSGPSIAIFAASGGLHTFNTLVWSLLTPPTAGSELSARSKRAQKLNEMNENMIFSGFSHEFLEA